MACNECKHFKGLTHDGMSMCRFYKLSEHGSLEEQIYIRPHNGCKQKKVHDTTPKEIEEFDPDMRRRKLSYYGRQK